MCMSAVITITATVSYWITASLAYVCRVSAIRFSAAVLPLDGKLEAALLHRADRKRCTECGGYFLPKSNRGKYCPDCTVKVRRRKESERQRKRYRLSTHLGYERSP